MMGPENCESLFARLKNKKARQLLGEVSGPTIVGHSTGTGDEEAGQCTLSPRKRKSGGWIGEKKSDLVPLLRLLDPGARNPGILRLLEGIASSEE